MGHLNYTLTPRRTDLSALRYVTPPCHRGHHRRHVPAADAICGKRGGWEAVLGKGGRREEEHKDTI